MEIILGTPIARKTRLNLRPLRGRGTADRQQLSPCLDEFRAHPLLTRTYSTNVRVPSMVTTLFPRPFSQGGVSDGLPAVGEEAPSSNVSEVDDEDLARVSKSMSYVDASPSLHSRWRSQDENRPRLDWIINGGETPK